MSTGSAIHSSETIEGAVTITVSTQDVADAFSAQVDQLAALALQGVHREYPNHLSHSLNSDADVLPPRQLTPAFYGCFDWHSAVHSHWTLARLSRLYPAAEFYPAAVKALKRSLTAENIHAELDYVSAAGRAGFERPYGMAWLLQLCAELRQWPEKNARNWIRNLEPLEQYAAGVFASWLPKLNHPLRVGTHAQTAFAFALVLDWARIAGHEDLHSLICTRSRDYYLNDSNAPLAYEPSGHDFLSPCLGEADLMRRVLAREDYLSWLDGFLPMIPRYSTDLWLHPLIVSDPDDGHLVHLHGLNLSRAWMLEGILSRLPTADPRRDVLSNTAWVHAEAGMQSIHVSSYAGSHWLGSFATYLITRRGLG